MSSMAAHWMKDVRAQRFWQSTGKPGLEGLYYGRLLCGDEMEECFVAKHLKPTAEKILRWKAVSEWLGRSDVVQNATISSLQEKG